MTSDYVIVSIKFCPQVGNCKYIIVCNFGGRTISDLRVTERGRGGGGVGGGLEYSEPSPVAKKKLGLQRFKNRGLERLGSSSNYIL